MRVALFVVAVTFIACYVALHTGFMAVDVGPFGPSIYVGPLGFHVTADLTSWFPGQYL